MKKKSEEILKPDIMKKNSLRCCYTKAVTVPYIREHLVKV